MPKRLIICGSTGSIGTQTLEVVRALPAEFEVCALTAGQNMVLLQEQLAEFQPQAFSLAAEVVIQSSAERYSTQERLVCELEADLVVMAVTGEQAIPLVVAALESGKDVALASKEVIVADGERIMALARQCGRQILPIDSEHSAIWQCLRAGKQHEVRRLWLTCSGGPFHDADAWPRERLAGVTPTEAVAHPNWSMGSKISVDSATLMNKALELIEAVHLFTIPPEQIEVVIHPQSHLHSAVEFCDGSIIAQCGTPDMRTAISYALTHPQRAELPFPKFSFFETTWDFASVDSTRFPSLQYARRALQLGCTAEFNQANEAAVAAFLAGEIGFLDIFDRVATTLE